MLKSKIAREYRDKYPDMPTLALARLIFKYESIIFKDVENCRGALRVKRIMRKCLRIIDECVNEMYDELFEDDEDI